jgi:hypothetical protein
MNIPYGRRLPKDVVETQSVAGIKHPKTYYFLRIIFGLGVFFSGAFTLTSFFLAITMGNRMWYLFDRGLLIFVLSFLLLNITNALGRKQIEFFICSGGILIINKKLLDKLTLKDVEHLSMVEQTFFVCYKAGLIVDIRMTSCPKKIPSKNICCMVFDVFRKLKEKA